MLANKQTPPPIGQAKYDTSVDCRSRSIKDLPDLIRIALRKVVHDYVTGWGIVLTQTPRERRRKKRLWDRRDSVRRTFRRPVWVHKAGCLKIGTAGEKTVMVQHREEIYLVHDLSDSGIGLTSDTPPKSRLVVLVFDSWQGQPVELLVQLRWRRRVGLQNYHCGGNILGVLTSP